MQEKKKKKKKRFAMCAQSAGKSHYAFISLTISQSLTSVLGEKKKRKKIGICYLKQLQFKWSSSCIVSPTIHGNCCGGEDIE